MKTPINPLFAMPALLLALAGLVTPTAAEAQNASQITFFITSAGPGDGGNLGGLAGADAHCAKLAKAAGSARTNWKAYLSAKPIIKRSPGKRPEVTPGINARERIGKGPWHNAKGVMIAKNVDDLHGAGVNINKQTALDEKGRPVNARGDKPNKHDILTGSGPLGRYSTAGGDTTCGNWTKNDAGSSAIVGHHDRAGLDKSWSSVQWNSSHGSRGCGEKDLPKSGGAGLFFCFAAN